MVLLHRHGHVSIANTILTGADVIFVSFRAVQTCDLGFAPSAASVTAPPSDWPRQSTVPGSTDILGQTHLYNRQLRLWVVISS
jgi:hypothetical protein